MPIATITEARDEILAYFTTAWNLQASPALLLYDDKRTDMPDDAPFARINVQHNVTPQVTVGGKQSLGGGGMRFRRNGVVTVQLFVPSGDGLTADDVLVDLVLDMFEGESTGSDRVQFLNARSNEIGQDGPWHHTNVITEFQYDRVK